MYGMDPNLLNNIRSMYQTAIQVGKGAVTGFFTSIYALITVPACYVVYKLYQVLEENGVIADFETTLTYQLSIVKYIADNCFVLLLDLHQFSSCIASAGSS